MLASPFPVNHSKQATSLLDSLIYEIIDGEPIYYKGYKNVLNGTQEREEIIWTGVQKCKIISYLLRLLFNQLDANVFEIAAGKPTLHLDNKNNFESDILVYKKEDFKPSDFNIKYSDKPAMLHIEVDVTADLDNLNETAYLQKKINKLMDFGTQKIIWIFSSTKQVLVVTKKEEWHWFDWDKSIDLIEGQSFNIGEYFKKEGIVV